MRLPSTPTTTSVNASRTIATTPGTISSSVHSATVTSILKVFHRLLPHSRQPHRSDSPMGAGRPVRSLPTSRYTTAGAASAPSTRSLTALSA